MTCPADIRLPAGDRFRGVRAVWQEPRPSYGEVSFNMGSTHSPGEFFFEGTTQVTYTASGNGPDGRITVSCFFFVVIEPDCDDECCDLPDGTFSVPTPRPHDCFAPPELDDFEALYEPSGTKTCRDGHSICSEDRKFLPPRPPRPPPMTPKFFVGEAEGGGPVVEPPTTTSTTTTTTSTSTTTTTLTPPESFCEFRDVDVTFLLDASGSVGTADFGVMQDFVADTISLLDVGSDAVRVAGAMYHERAIPGFDFDFSFSRPTLRSEVLSWVYPSDRNYGTASGAALNYVTNNLLVPSAGYRGGEAVVYFFSDGRSAESAAVVQAAADALKATGARVVAVGISGLVDVAQLEVIASSVDDIVLVNDFTELTAAVSEDLAERLCADTTPSTAAPTTTTTTTTTTDNVAQRCQGRTTDLTAEECRCTPLPDCHTCGVDALLVPVADTCQLCKNSAYLLDGVCVATCPEGFVGTGFGRFGRACEPVETSPVVQQCAGITTSITADACRCARNCHTCEWTDGLVGDCSICKNSAYLLNGDCVESCPTGFTPTGTGSFRRECVRDTPTTPAAVTTAELDFCVGRNTLLLGESCSCNADCHTCEWASGTAGQCIKCKNEAYLLDGECVATCPDGFDSLGSGSFGKECVELTSAADDQCQGITLRDAGTSCRCASDCHTCAWVNGLPSTCSLCKNSAFLLDGTCVESCPAGYDEDPNGRFGSLCVESSRRRRSILALAGEMALGSHAAGSPALVAGMAAGVAMVVLAVVATVIVVHRRRRAADVLPLHERAAVDETEQMLLQSTLDGVQTTSS